MIIVKIELMSAFTGLISEIGRMYLTNDVAGSMAANGKLGRE